MKPVIIKIATAPLAREVIRMVHLADDRGASAKAKRIWRRMERAGFDVRFEINKRKEKHDRVQESARRR